MRNLDFTSWQGLLSTLLGLALITLIGVGVRLLVMQTIQQRRARENRQINERLRTLIAAYKTLGGSFTGNLAVDPRHLRDLKREEAAAAEGSGPVPLRPSGDRARRMRARRRAPPGAGRLSGQGESPVAGRRGRVRARLSRARRG